MEWVETRELAYFIAVAEELHFSRAAERLGMSQPPLSRAIKQLEHRLGVVLLERGNRKVVLTEAGEVFLHEGRKALDAVAASARRAQRAGRPARRLVLVMKPNSDGGLLAGVLAAYASDPDAIAVDVLVCGLGEQATVLRDGRADAALLHSPYDDLSGFDTEELLVERQVAVVPRGHRLAGRASVCLADLDGEPLPRWPGTPADGATGPLVRDTGQLMQLIALNQTIAVLPESVRGNLRGDLVCVPVLDAPPTTVLIAWPERSRSRALAAFVRVATEVACRRPLP
jgi:DNA-binding transcriptional LysR family regulator